MSSSEKRFVTSAEKIHEYIESICAIGPRVCGSDNDKKAAQYCVGQFREMGLDVKTESFEVMVFQEKYARLRIVKPELKELTCVSFLRSCSTPKGGIDCEVIYVGAGAEKDYEGKTVSGKLVFLEPPSGSALEKPHIVTLIEIAKKHGSTGLIMASTTPGNVIGGWGGARFGTPIPAVSISVEDSLYLRELLRKGSVTLSLVLETSLEKGTAQNVIAIHKGRKTPRELVLITAHSDTLQNTVGANDNASGIAVVLEVARLVSKENTGRSIAFVIFSGEEGGCIGSSQYVEMNKEQLGNIRAMLNFDIVGVGNEMELIREGIRFPYGFPPGKKINPPKWLFEYMLSLAKELGYRVVTRPSFACGDEGPFEDAGVPAISLFKGPNPIWHSDRDTLARCDVNCLKSIADIAATFAYRTSNDTLPNK